MDFFCNKKDVIDYIIKDMPKNCEITYSDKIYFKFGDKYEFISNDGKHVCKKVDQLTEEFMHVDKLTYDHTQINVGCTYYNVEYTNEDNIHICHNVFGNIGMYIETCFPNEQSRYTVKITQKCL
jgi:hypothetical protein